MGEQIMAPAAAQDRGDIFVVDGPRATVSNLGRLLSSTGFRVRSTSNIGRALTEALARPPELFLVSVSLPDLSGYELCRRLKEYEPLRHIPVLFLGLSEAIHKTMAFSAGGVGYITEPVHDEELLARIETHLRLYKLQLDLEKRNALLEERTAELSRANAELARAARMKDEFLASTSHELRTPLHAILSAAETLEEGLYGSLNEDQLRSVYLIQNSGWHLSSVIGDILDLSKVAAGRLELIISPTFVQEVATASLAFVREAAMKKQLTLSTFFDPAVRTLAADGQRLKQILVNLLQNAVKFTPTGGSVCLQVRGDRDRCVAEISVSDTGIGISEEDMEQIFEPFSQVDRGIDRQFDGTGLGLALVARLVELHGGSVRVDSPGHNQGSSFTVALPWQEVDHGVRTDANELTEERVGGVSSSQENAAKPLVLLAEDNENTIAAIVEYLQGRGYRVRVARSGVEAIERARDETPDVILMDIQIPELDGMKATRELRRDPLLCSTPIIAVTALAMAGDRERCLEAGADAYLSKPVHMRELVTTIERLRSPVSA